MHFQVGMIGGNQMLVKLPRTALGCKKRSGLEVVLTRANRPIPAVVEELFDGVFSVQLQPRDTYGDIEVNLIMSKPPLSENLTVSLDKHSKNDYKPLRKALRAVNGTLHDAVDSLWAYLPRWQSDMPLQGLPQVVGRLKELKETLEGLLTSHPMPVRSILNVMSTLQTQASTRADSVYADVAWLTEKGFTQGRRMLKHVTDEIDDTGSAPLKMFKSVAHADVAWLTEKGFAQGRRMLKHVTGEINDTRAALFKIFKSVVPAELSPEPQPGLLTKKLGAAQGRARQVLSNAAGKLRSSSAGGWHKRD
jgi:hypothetical protein